jgi:hypothetical protein
MARVMRLWHIAICPAQEAGSRRACSDQCGYEAQVALEKAHKAKQPAPIEVICCQKPIHDDRAVDEAWCKTCMKTTIFYGLLYSLSADGVGVYGSYRGCNKCRDYVWLDLNGMVIDQSKMKNVNDNDEEAR